ncbi:putative NAD(P)H-dependent D-xylose reductase xyl1 [Aspergillus steynii IBT 23096]|uniref:D-xylose reductase [NAD(P)H] n=1 Tax=Aspergillus steynii IBT 23096 TaxID=1392250 RepID=A0A2I2GCY6_9EURO|nr:putative NAD(P)H-dependent D-xylose reductase xyl1 [Aspergillus steynii IBT 23096]PLB50746.1 putative NAD(P)H-dependent D-xylose reductase xyl1 [Aspergillus steynii IBT 23096]
MPCDQIKLNNGLWMPLAGFGLWNIDKSACAEAVYNAIKEGYRCFDGACDYGNEREAGQGIARAIQEGLVKREELFIVSKLWGTFHARDQVEPSARRQLADWGLDSFDLYLVHFPIALKYVDPEERYPPGWAAVGSKSVETARVPIHDTWRGMESLVDAKLARGIGVSNFSIQLLRDLLCYARIAPAVLQIEHHPYLVQSRLVGFAHQQGVAVTAYCSFGPQSSAAAQSMSAAEVAPLLEHPLITSVARRHGKTSSQVLLRWATQRGVAVIPRSGRSLHMRQNLDMQWQLTELEIQSISDLNEGRRFNDPVAHGYNVPIFD